MAGNEAVEGIMPAKMHPQYLHANSNIHVWAFSAIAELIDNAYDPDVMAKALRIEKLDMNGLPVLRVKDNGHGMCKEQLQKMLSFGFNEKHQVGNIKPVGRFGNGFKSGSMRLGKDAVVFTRCKESMSVGFLSQTYLQDIGTASLIVPIVSWSLPDNRREYTMEELNNLRAILDHCPLFSTEEELLDEMESNLGRTREYSTGTNILIYNLKAGAKTPLELDFVSDPTDIRCPETYVDEKLGMKSQQDFIAIPAYRQSLKAYCSILFKTPRMNIYIQGHLVKNKLIDRSLAKREVDFFEPKWLDGKKIRIVFGFNRQLEDPECYGLMMYHNNRLIKAFERIGCQVKANEDGVGVIGVVEADFLEPTHNKQDFTRDAKYRSLIQNVGSKLSHYYHEKNQDEASPSLDLENTPRSEWVRCVIKKCGKNRRLLTGYDPDMSKPWYCRDNPDAAYNRCEIPEELTDEAQRKTYKRTYTKEKEKKKKPVNTPDKKVADTNKVKQQSNEMDTGPEMVHNFNLMQQNSLVSMNEQKSQHVLQMLENLSQNNNNGHSNSTAEPSGLANRIAGSSGNSSSSSESNSFRNRAPGPSGVSIRAPGPSGVSKRAVGLNCISNIVAGPSNRVLSPTGVSNSASGSSGYGNSTVGKSGISNTPPRQSSVGNTVSKNDRMKTPPKRTSSDSANACNIKTPRIGNGKEDCDSSSSHGAQRAFAALFAKNASCQTESVVLGFASPEELQLTRLSPLEKEQILVSKFREVHELKQELVSTKQERDNRDEEFRNLSIQHDRMVSKIDEAKNVLDQLQNKVISSTQELKTTKQELDACKRGKVSAEKELESTKKELNETKNGLDATWSEGEEAKREISRLRKELEETRKHAGENQKNRENAIRELVASRKLVASRNSVKQMQSHVQNSKRELETKQRELEGAKKEIEKYSTVITNIESSLSQLK